MPQEVLFAQWRDVARTHGFTPEHVAALVRGRAPEPGPAEVTPEHGTLPGALDDPAPAIPHEPAALLGHPDLQPEDGISSWSGTPNPEYPVAGSASPLPDAAPRPYRGFEEPIPYLSPNARPGGGFIPPEGTPSLPPLSQRLLDAAVQRALQNATTEHSYFSERDLIRYLARECQWLPPITPFRIWEAAHALLERSPDIVPLGVAKQERVYTTKELLHIEQEMLQKVERSRREESNPTLLIGTTLARWLHPGLNADQREVFQRLTDLQGRIQVLDGITGAGKSQLLHACAQAWKLSGYKVIGIALTSRAARKMEKEIGIASVSLANFLWQVDRSLLRDLAEGLVQAIREEFLGMPRITQEQRYLAVDDRTMIVLDGAHAVGTRLLAPLITIRERANALLTLVGDRAHLPYLAAGGGYAAICDQLHAPRLQQPRRQEREWAQEAVRNAAEGNARQVLQEYAERGLLDVASTRAGAREALVDAWKREGIQRPREHHIFTSTRDDADTLNRMAQKARREAGKLGKIALTVNGYKIHRNDRVLFLKTSRALGLDAGATGTIIALEPITGSLLVRTDDGRFVGVPTLRYHHLSLGYASTTHQARDRVVETAYVLLNGMAQDREVFYTQLSRAEGVTRLFAHTQDNDPALADLVERMEISHAQELGATMLQRQQEHERDYEIAPER